MLPIIFMEVKMLLFDNSVLKMYLSNAQLNFHIKSFNYFILFLCLIKVYDKKIITRPFPYHPRYHPPPFRGLIWGSGMIPAYMGKAMD